MPGTGLQHALALLTSVTLLAVPARTSDPVGVYAVVDRVVLEPADGTPQRIQVWGVFALADRRDRNSYRPAQRGYLYYSANAENPQATRAEWQDLRSVAGTGDVIAFGGRYDELGRVRRASEAPAQPDRYPVGFGMVRMPRTRGMQTAGFEVARVPGIESPADGATVRAGAVRLTARNVADPDVRYVFEIARGSERERSEPIAPGNEATSWTPRMRIESGQQYEWRVHVSKEQWSGPPAVAAFRGAR